MERSVIGKVMATEKTPTTIDEFWFWTSKDLIINPFDVVCVQHVDNSITYGVVEEISHITDSESFLANFLSSDFGSLSKEAVGNTNRLGMNCVKAKVTGNNKNLFTPVHEGSLVSSATTSDITEALGLNKISNPSVVGYINMYEGSKNIDRITLPVKVDRRFLIGPEGAHLNISGISGLAAKTSYAMFLLNALLQEQKKEGDIKSAHIIFNVKGCDLLAMDEEPDCGISEGLKKAYAELGLEAKPFENVTYYYPQGCTKDEVISYVQLEHYKNQQKLKKAYQYSFTYEDNKEDIDLLFADIDDSTQTIESIINYILSEREFSDLKDWNYFIDKVKTKTQAGVSGSNKDITVASWRKFSRIIYKVISRNPLFPKARLSDHQVDIKESIKNLKQGETMVIDIAKLSEGEQAFVFGSVMRAVQDLRFSSQADNEKLPERVILFVDELNKYASSDLPKSSPIVKTLLDVAERGRSLGIVLFSAEQFKSAIHDRVKGNCSTHAYGRTNAIEISKPDYRYIPNVYKNMMPRLKQGEYILQNPVFTSVLKIQFPLPAYKQFK